jgi:putative glycosyltransferase (TIGR04348 family)
MNIQIITPASAGTTSGNRVTAERWAMILKSLGHRVSLVQQYDGQSPDKLIALHARRSHSSIVRFRREHPRTPIVLALTGTDVYRDIHQNARARKSLDLADKLIVLQPLALRALNTTERKKAHVIYQSIDTRSRAKRWRRESAADHFEACVIGHLRPVKDPFRAAMAARRLPESSRIRITQVGRALAPQMQRRALREMQVNQRYRWRGELSHAGALRVMADSRLLVISSRMEGGANVLSEGIVAGIPVLASRIDGNVGILGDNYPGLFRSGDTEELRGLMLRAEMEPKFLNGLAKRISKLAPLFDPRRERQAWGRLLAEAANKNNPRKHTN